MPIPIYKIDREAMQQEILKFLKDNPNMGYAVGELHSHFYPESKGSRTFDEVKWIRECLDNISSEVNAEIVTIFFHKEK